MQLRQLTMADVPAIGHIQKRAYPPALFETEETYRAKLESWPSGGWGFFNGADMLGFTYFHPWILGQVVPLGSGHFSPPAQPTCLYLHDVVVDPALRGQGLARKLVQHAQNHAHRLALGHIALVAVNNAEEFWIKMGFIPQRQLTYGAGCGGVYMVMALSVV